MPFKKVYSDGTEVDDCDWEDGESCWGYYVDSIDDIDFCKDEDIDGFDETYKFVGDEWTIPELVIRNPDTKLFLMAEGSDALDAERTDAEWTDDLSKAKVFRHWNCAYNAFLEHGKRLHEFAQYTANRGHDAIKDKDEWRAVS